MTVKKGFWKQLHVKEAMMTVRERYASVVSLVEHASESVRTIKGAAGNQQDNVKATVKRSGENVKLLSYFFY